jgi:hypothetical protein
MQNIDRRVKPAPQSLVAAPGLAELVDLVLKYGKNVRRRVACLELGSQGMGSEILSSLFTIFLEGFFEDDIEIRRGRRQCRRLERRATSGSGRLTHAEGDFVGRVVESLVESHTAESQRPFSCCIWVIDAQMLKSQR